MRSRAPWAAFALALAMGSASANEAGFSSSLTRGLTEQLAHKFGPDARTRLEAWREFIASERSSQQPELEVLDAVNSFFNRIPFVDDPKHWGVADYWASPAEMVASNGGDCEDFSIAKYFALKEIGVPIARLRITHVEAAGLGQPHMVLLYYPASGDEPLVLDNLDPRMRPAWQRPDLRPVYEFNDDEVRIPATRSVAGSPMRIRTWRGLLARLQRERRA